MLASVAMPAWFDQAFGPWYVKLYAHRDREEAARSLETLAPWMGTTGPILDVACGSGRHLDILLSGGVVAFGIDRSRALLAATGPALKGHVLRGDMRMLPFPSGLFGTLLSLFTSFGYFESDEAHRELLREYARVTAPGGRLVLDLVNPTSLRGKLVPDSVRMVDGHSVHERRRVEPREDGERVVKEITISDPQGGKVEQYQEVVALFDREQILDMLSATEWEVLAVLGDYGGAPWSLDSPRLVVVAGKGAA